MAERRTSELPKESNTFRLRSCLHVQDPFCIGYYRVGVQGKDSRNGGAGLLDSINFRFNL